MHKEILLFFLTSLSHVFSVLFSLLSCVVKRCFDFQSHHTGQWSQVDKQYNKLHNWNPKSFFRPFSCKILQIYCTEYQYRTMKYIFTCVLAQSRCLSPSAVKKMLAVANLISLATPAPPFPSSALSFTIGGWPLTLTLHPLAAHINGMSLKRQRPLPLPLGSAVSLTAGKLECCAEE